MPLKLDPDINTMTVPAPPAGVHRVAPNSPCGTANGKDRHDAGPGPLSAVATPVAKPHSMIAVTMTRAHIETRM